MIVGAAFFWYHEDTNMEFRKRHKKLYFFWVVISFLVALSMVGFLLAPLFY